MIWQKMTPIIRNRKYFECQERFLFLARNPKKKFEIEISILSSVLK